MDALCTDLGLLGGFILPAFLRTSYTYFLICRVFLFRWFHFLHWYSYYVFLYRYICIFIFTYMSFVQILAVFPVGAGAVVQWCVGAAVVVSWWSWWCRCQPRTFFALPCLMVSTWISPRRSSIFLAFQPFHGGGSLRSREKLAVAPSPRCISNLLPWWMQTHLAHAANIVQHPHGQRDGDPAAGHPQTCWHLQFLQHRGRTNFLLHRFLNRKFLNDLVIWMAEALLKSRPVLPHDHFKHFRGNIPLTAGMLAKNAPRLLEDWSWYPLAFFGLLLWHVLVLATIGTAFCVTSNQLQWNIHMVGTCHWLPGIYSCRTRSARWPTYGAHST